MTQASLERRVQLWRTTASDAEIALGSVLSCALAVDSTTLESIASRVWEFTSGEIDQALGRLLRRPFVQETADGYRMLTPLREEARENFATSDGSRFAEVCRNLANHEELAYRDADDFELWALQARVAYYLAAVDSHQSVDRFRNTFARPPREIVAEGRRWVASLAISQSHYLGDEYAREVAFFKAFKDYQIGIRHNVVSGFQATIDTGAGLEDELGAIAGHLYAVLRPNSSRSEEILRESIRVSDALGLIENSVMARNTYVARLQRREQFVEAAAEAEQALELARRAEAPYLECFTETTFLNARWLVETDGRRQSADPKVAGSYAARLIELSLSYRRMSDYGGAVYAVNAAASVLRDSGRPVDALAVVESAMSTVPDLAGLPELAGLAKTVGSLTKSLSGAERVRAYSVLRDIDQAKTVSAELPDSGLSMGM